MAKGEDQLDMSLLRCQESNIDYRGVLYRVFWSRAVIGEVKVTTAASVWKRRRRRRRRKRIG